MEQSKEIERDLETFYRHYIEVFNREDVDEFLNCFARPYAVVSNERGLSVVQKEADHASNHCRIMTALKNRGWVRSDIVRITAWPLDQKVGLILADVTRRKSDGSVLEEIRACYELHREGDFWKIVSITEVKPPFLGPGAIPR